MAEARTSGWILALAAMAGAYGPALAQGPLDPTPVVVEERPVAPPQSGELGAADVARAAAMLRDLGATFATLAAREGEVTARTDWIVTERTYRRAATLLDTLLAGGQIAFRGLPAGEAAAVDGGGIVIDPTLAGQWRPETVRVARRQGLGDWPAISRLASVLVEQLVLFDRADGWDEWAAAHERADDLRRLMATPPDQSLRPLLARYWHIQDKYLANDLATAGADPQAAAIRAGRAADLSNDMLVVVRQVEAAAGWPWRKALETAWSGFTERAHRISAVAAAPRPRPRPVQIAAVPAKPESVTEPAAEDAPAPAPAVPEVAVPPEPRSADFDELFAGLEQPPSVTAAGSDESPDTGAAERAALAADVQALRREAEARQAATQTLEDSLRGMSARVDELAAGAAEQGRQLAALADRLAAAETRAETRDQAHDAATAQALADLTARQAQVDASVADLRRQVGPTGLPREVAELRAAMAAEETRNRDAEQLLETRVQDRLRALRADIEAARRQAADVRAGLAAFRPSATAVAVPLRDEAARQQALRQVFGVGLGLLLLLAAAIALWRRGARAKDPVPAAREEDLAEAAQDADLSELMAGLRVAERNALRDEMAQLRGEIASERGRAGDLAARLERLTERLTESQSKSERLQADLAHLRAGAQEVGKHVLAGAAQGEAMGDVLTRLRTQIEAERDHAAELRQLIAEARSVAKVAEPAAIEAPAADHPLVRPAAPSPQDPILRRRTIEALHRGDLGGFERAFARLADLPLAAAHHVVRAPDGRELALVCRAVGVAKPHYAAILILVHRAGTGEGHLAPRQLAQAMAYFDQASPEAAANALDAVRRQTWADEPRWAGELA